MACPITINPVMIAIGITIFAVAFVVGIYMVQYIYKDAVRRNLNAEFWMIFALIFPGVSWILYFLVRKEKRV
ncbi:MAG: hypothetical protein KAW66_03655 [Candidatus Lokiarchaeota archaeon]|nr:hypothetical protein [Candidatus Lokiarchaeota archaeon]